MHAAIAKGFKMLADELVVRIWATSFQGATAMDSVLAEMCNQRFKAHGIKS